MTGQREDRARMTGRRGDRGSVTVELVLVAPLFIALLLFVVFCGRMGRTAQIVRELAGSAARAASVARTEDAARVAAGSAVSVASGDLSCRPPDVSFGSDGTVDTVSVRVRCEASLAGLALLPINGTRTFSSSATEAIDAYRGN
jgi:Flp pilus assembly protein TadG